MSAANDERVNSQELPPHAPEPKVAESRSQGVLDMLRIDRDILKTDYQREKVRRSGCHSPCRHRRVEG